MVQLCAQAREFVIEKIADGVLEVHSTVKNA
jgi:hypothetical protein